MNRMEFMKILERQLLDLSESEREEALQYYEDYLNDAGIENEQEALEELGAPEHLAETIKAGLNGGSGEFTERGYQSARRDASEVTVRSGDYAGSGSQAGQEQAGTKTSWQQDHAQTSRQQDHAQTSWQQNGYQNAAGNGPEGYRSGEQKPADKGNSASKTILIILLCIILSPIILPLAGGLLAAAAAILLGLFCLWGGLAVAGMAMFLAGIIALVVGIIKLFTLPAAGAVLIGTGLLCFGIGLLLCAFLIWLFIRIVPPFCRWLAALCRKPFERKGGAA